MYKWLMALKKVYVANLEIEPIRRDLAEKEKLKAVLTKELMKQNEIYLQEKKKVEALQNEFEAARKEANRLDAEVNNVKEKLKRASILRKELPEENSRWEASAAHLDSVIHNLVGDCFLAAACISYYGPFTGRYRNNLVKQWINKCEELDIPISPNFVLSNRMLDPLLIQKWNTWGLPTDSVSIDNAVLVQEGIRYPLLIDPQSQATKWLTRMLNELSRKKIQTDFVMAGDPRLIQKVTLALRSGKYILIQEVQETLNPQLDPLLLKQTFPDLLGNPLVNFNGQDIEMDKNFSIFMTTKLANPNFLPEVFIRSTVINFSVTELGLEEQLLSLIVQKDEPERQAQRIEIVKTMSASKIDLKTAEDKILSDLVACTGDILESEDLVKSLSESKVHIYIYIYIYYIYTI